MKRVQLDTFRFAILYAANRMVDQKFCHSRESDGMVKDLTRKRKHAGEVACHFVVSNGGIIPGIEPRFEALNTSVLLQDDPQFNGFPDCYDRHTVESEICQALHRKAMEVCQPDQGALDVDTISITYQASVDDDDAHRILDLRSQ